MYNNIFLYERDSMGNDKFLQNQEKILREYIDKEFGKSNIKIYRDKCGLSEERCGLQNLLRDLKNEKVDWVISTHSNRFYRVNYKFGKKRLLNILKEIKESGTNIAFASELVKIEKENEIEQYVNQINERFNNLK